VRDSGYFTPVRDSGYVCVRLVCTSMDWFTWHCCVAATVMLLYQSARFCIFTLFAMRTIDVAAECVAVAVLLRNQSARFRNLFVVLATSSYTHVHATLDKQMSIIFARRMVSTPYIGPDASVPTTRAL
jgi:hypothetical protein